MPRPDGLPELKAQVNPAEGNWASMRQCPLARPLLLSLLVFQVACERDNRPTQRAHAGPVLESLASDAHPTPRPWLNTRHRTVGWAELEPGYERLSKHLSTPKRVTATLDRRLEESYYELRPGVKAWLAAFGVTPSGPLGLSPQVSERLRTDALSKEGALLALLILQFDPGAEPKGLLGQLVRNQPADSRFLRQLALELMGYTNRREYLELLLQTADDPDIRVVRHVLRSAGRMDGGVAVLQRVLDRKLFALHRDIVGALSQSRDPEVRHIARTLLASDTPGASEIGIEVMAHLGIGPDDLGAVFDKVALVGDLSDRSRATGLAALRVANSEAAESAAAILAYARETSSQLRVDALRALAVLDCDTAAYAMATLEPKDEPLIRDMLVEVLPSISETGPCVRRLAHAVMSAFAPCVECLARITASLQKSQGGQALAFLTFLSTALPRDDDGD